MAIYLPGAELGSALETAETLLKDVGFSTQPNVTISCGLSCWDSEKPVDVEQLFKDADDALYAAKKAGKNRVVIR